MHGAELPCGTTLGVQPVDAEYKKKAHNDDTDTRSRPAAARGDPASAEARHRGPAEGTSQQPTTATATVANTATVSSGPDEKNAKDDGDEDLDDFFASLE